MPGFVWEVHCIIISSRRTEFRKWQIWDIHAWMESTGDWAYHWWHSSMDGAPMHGNHSSTSRVHHIPYSILYSIRLFLETARITPSFKIVQSLLSPRLFQWSWMNCIWGYGVIIKLCAHSGMAPLWYRQDVKTNPSSTPCVPQGISYHISLLHSFTDSLRLPHRGRSCA